MLSAPAQAPRPWLALAWLLLVAVATGWGLGAYPLIEPDEGRNAEVAREMVSSGDYVVPHLQGLPYLDKPTLFFAATAASLRIGGNGEGAARAVSFLCALLTAALVGAAARRLFGRAAAWVAATVALCSPLMVGFARTVIFDSMLTLLVTAALLSFLFAVEASTRGEPALLWCVAGWASIAAGVLVKGPVALLLPLLVAAPYALWRRRGRAIWHPAGLLVLVAILAPWLWWMGRAVPGFLHYALVVETWRRVTTTELHRTAPWWYYLPMVLGGCFPWTVFLLGDALAGRLSRRGQVAAGARDARVLYIVLWIVLPLVFFSLSQSKRPQYVLPLVPAIALLVGWAFARREPRPLTASRAAAVAWLAMGALFAGAMVALPHRAHKLSPDLARVAAQGLPLLAAAAAIAGVVALIASARGWSTLTLVALALPVALLPVLTLPALGVVARERSTPQLAQALAPRLAAGARVVGVAAYSPTLAFYLQHPYPVATTNAEELRSNYLLRTSEQWIGAPGSLLRPRGEVKDALARCEMPTFALVDRGRAEQRELAALGLGEFASNDDYVLLGPCAASAGSRLGER